MSQYPFTTLVVELTFRSLVVSMTLAAAVLAVVALT
jgi:hypothetical protein